MPTRAFGTQGCAEQQAKDRYQVQDDGALQKGRFLEANNDQLAGVRAYGVLGADPDRAAAENLCEQAGTTALLGLAAAAGAATLCLYPDRVALPSHDDTGLLYHGCPVSLPSRIPSATRWTVAAGTSPTTVT